MLANQALNVMIPNIYWKENSLFDTGDGTYNYVTIILSEDNEFPYRVTMFQYNRESIKSSEWESKKFKIHDGYLFTQENNVHGFSFKILEKEGKFKCYSDRYHVVGSLKNHTK